LSHRPNAILALADESAVESRDRFLFECQLGVPDPARDFSSGTVNVENLMKARDSAELRECSAWLYKFEGKNDAEVQELVHAIGLRVASLLRSEPGKAVRF